MEMKSGWLALAQYVFIAALTGASSLIICFALWLLRRLKRKRNFDSSPSLLVYLLSLLLCCLALFVQYVLLLSCSLLPPPQLSATQLIFWTGLLPGSLIPATPISVLFLSLDRLLIVLWPSLYMRKPTKLGLAAASAVAIFGLFAMNLGVNYAQRPTREVPECISFGCLTSDASRLIYAVNRLVVALPNFLAGSAFLAVLFAYRRRIQQNAGPSAESKSQKMGDRLALWVVLFEFGLDLLPNLANFALTAYDINVSVYVGAFRSISFSLCAFCSIGAHTGVLWRIFASKTTPTSTKSMAPTNMQMGAASRQTYALSRARFSVRDLAPTEGQGRKTSSYD